MNYPHNVIGRRKNKLLNKKSVFSSVSKHSKYSKKALDMIHEINYNKVIEDSDSLHEFIIITLSQAFKAKPRPVEGVRLNDFKYLTIAVVKGKKKEST